MPASAALIALTVIGVIAVVLLRFHNRKAGLDAGSTVRIGQPNPAVVPAGLTEKLCEFYATRGDVRAAYLGMMQVVSVAGKPELVIAVDTTGDFSLLVEESSRLLLELPRTGYGLGIIDANEAVGQQLKKTVRPFYSRDGR